MTETVQFVGGPLDGRHYGWTTARYVNVPDAKDMIHVWVDRWGEMTTLFGEHTYEMKAYRRGDECRHQLEYVGYKKPVLGDGMVEVRFP